MSRPTPSNLVASVHQRLLNLSRERGEDFSLTLACHGIEGFAEVLGELNKFLAPPLSALGRGQAFHQTWAPGGPWSKRRA